MDIKEIVHKEIENYAMEGVRGTAYVLTDKTGNVFALIDVATFHGERIVDTGLLVRLAGSQVVIEKDMNNKPLVEALLLAGIPRSRIVLAYAGESVEGGNTH